VSAVVSGALDRTRAEPPPTEQPSARRFPLVAWLLVALQSMLMLCLTVLYPPFQAPDEVPHVDYVLAHRHGEWFDGVGERRLQLGVIKAFNQVPQTQSSSHVGGQAPVPRSQRKSFDALGSGPSKSLFPNQMVQHPPLYYGLAAGFSYLLPDFSHRRFDVQVFWLRLFSVLLMAPIPLLIYAAARRATGNTNIALVAAIIPLSIPTYLRAGASVTNDSLLTLLTVAAAALLVRIAWGDRTRRIAVLLGLAWGGALLTKGFALELPPAIVLAYLVGADGSWRDRVRVSWPGIVISGAIGFAVGGWWWIRNLVVYGQVQPNGFANLPDSVRQQGFGRDRPHGSELDFFGNFFRLLGQRMWGSLGLTDLPSLPHSLLFTASALVVAGLVLAVLAGLPRLRARVELPGWTVGRAVSLVLPTLLTLAVVYLNARSNYFQNHPLGGIQSRYLIPTVLGMAICVAVALHLVAGRWRHWLPLAALVATLLFILASVYEVISVEMSSASPGRVQRLKDALHFVVGWAPFPSAVTALLLGLTVGLAAATVVVVMRGTSRGAADDVAAPVSAEAG
jgi:small subunit ribosomal protein S36